MTIAITHPQKVARQADYWRRRGRLDVAERLEAELLAANRCKYCGRALSDPASVELGAGADCLAKRAEEQR